MGSVTDYLEENHIHGIDEDEIVDALEQLRIQGWFSEQSTGLTQAEAEYLSEHGGVTDNRTALARAAVSATARRSVIANEILTVKQAAELLGISPSRVRHRISEGSIYALPSTRGQSSRRIPNWQFHDGAVIPGMVEVLNVLPEDFMDTEVRSFVFNATVDHPSRYEPVPLIEWLLDGGDPGEAAALAAEQSVVI